MSRAGIFPTKDGDFNTYFGTAATYLTTNATSLNVSAGNVTALATLKGFWDTKYPQSQDVNTATKTIIEEKTGVRDAIEDLLREIFGDIPQSALTAADRNTLNLHERQAGSARPAITTSPGLRLFALGDLEIRIECRVVGDESRPSLHPDADAIEFRTLIGDTPPATY